MTEELKKKKGVSSAKAFVSRWVLNTAGMLLFWSGFFRAGFGADTIGQAYMPLININAAFQYGRYLTYMLDIIAYRLGYRMDKQYKTTFLAVILMLGLSVTILQLVFSEYAKDMAGKLAETASSGQKLLFTAGIWTLSMLPLANVLFSEMYMFPENIAGYSLCYVTASLAAYFICRVKGRAGWISGIAMILVSCMFYQNGVFFAVIPMLLYFYIEYWTGIVPQHAAEDSAQDKDGAASPTPSGSVRFSVYFFRSAAVIIAALASGFFNMKLQAFLQETSLGKGTGKNQYVGDLFANFSKLPYYLNTFFSTSLQLLPRLYLPLLLLLLSDAAVVCLLVRRKRYLQIVMTLFTQFVMFGLVCSIPLLMEKVSFFPRIVFLMYEVLAAAAFMALAVISEDRKETASSCRRLVIIQILSGTAVVFFAVQAFFTVQIAENHYLSNRQDLIYADLVQQKIRKYEVKTGIQVKKIAAVRDTVSTHYYHGIYYTWDQINERVLGLSTVSLLCYTSENGRDFHPTEMDDEVFDKYFKDRNWDEFDLDEQVIIVGDTLYWCVF